MEWRLCERSPTFFKFDVLLRISYFVLKINKKKTPISQTFGQFVMPHGFYDQQLVIVGKCLTFFFFWCGWLIFILVFMFHFIGWHLCVYFVATVALISISVDNKKKLFWQLFLSWRCKALGKGMGRRVTMTFQMFGSETEEKLKKFLETFISRLYTVKYWYSDVMI